MKSADGKTSKKTASGQKEPNVVSQIRSFISGTELFTAYAGTLLGFPIPEPFRSRVEHIRNSLKNIRDVYEQMLESESVNSLSTREIKIINGMHMVAEKMQEYENELDQYLVYTDKKPYLILRQPFKMIIICDSGTC